MASRLRVGHAAADGFEDLGSAQFGNEQSEDIPARGGVGAHVASGSSAPLDDARELQVAQRPVDGGP